MYLRLGAADITTLFHPDFLKLQSVLSLLTPPSNNLYIPMAFVSATLILVLFGLFSYYFRIRILRNGFAERHGCQAPPKRGAQDPILGIDRTLQDSKLSKAFQSLPAGASLFHTYGQTFRETMILGTVIKTRSAENINTIHGLKAKDWGIQPFRLPAMNPFCGKGFITTDGLVGNIRERFSTRRFTNAIFLI